MGKAFLTGQSGKINKGDALQAHVLLDKIFSSKNLHNASGTMPTKGAQTYTPGTADQTIASEQYLTGTQTIKGDENLIPGNIKEGISIFGKEGALPVGRRFATGTAVTTWDGYGQHYITVSGLAFKPSVVYATDKSGILVHDQYGDPIDVAGFSAAIYNNINIYEDRVGYTLGGVTARHDTEFPSYSYLLQGGFRLLIEANTGGDMARSIPWIAIE